MKAIATALGIETEYVELTEAEQTTRNAEEATELVSRAGRLLKEQIIKIENQQTPRRIREAALGIDEGWLAALEVQIVTLREQL